ncbi:Uma2 family endonuclease [Streptomyces incanus]|uniref:Uma2 family endonuclease n=1 Tax=Streptomyces incanus TaxID=887453 RepID=A0ABW0XV18_9ACTN
MTAYDPISEEILLDWFVAFDPPEGFRAELVEGELVLTPPPDGEHEEYLWLIVKQVMKASRTDMQLSGNKGLKLKRGGAGPEDHVIPDSTFAPTALRLYRGAAPWMPCEGVAMVVEVTFLRPRLDRETKRRCYARGGIPLYLLVDREAASITLFSTPGRDDYHEQCTRPLGKPLPLPDPFTFDLDTADFL